MAQSPLLCKEGNAPDCNSSTTSKTALQGSAGAVHGVGFNVVNFKDGVQSCYIEKFPNPFRGIENHHVPIATLDGSPDCDHLAQPRAVNVVHIGQVENK